MLIKAGSSSLNPKSKPPINALTKGMIKADQKPPKMKTKASEGRRLLPVVVWILELLGPSNEHARTRLFMMQALRDMYDAMDEWRRGDMAANQKVVERGRMHLALYKDLSETASHVVFWRMYPKHHLFCHGLEVQLPLHGNPRDCWCYLDEHEIGMGVTCAESVHPPTLHRQLLQRHRL